MASSGLCTNFIRSIAVVAALSFACPAIAQPADALSSAPTEQQLLQKLHRIEGLGTIPDVRSYVVEQPVGRQWEIFHEIYLHWIGGVAIIGILALLVAFYLWRGPLRFGPRSGFKMLRFSAF